MLTRTAEDRPARPGRPSTAPPGSARHRPAPRGTELLFSGRRVLADEIRAGVPGIDGCAAAAAAGATIGLVAVVLHVLEHVGAAEETRAAVTATLKRLERALGQLR